MWCQEEFISLDFIEDILYETHEKNQVFNSEILNKVVDVSFASCHENSLHGSCEDKFDKMLGKLQLENPCHGKQIIEKFEGCHDPVVEYVENICGGNGWLCDCSKDQVFYHNLLPFSSSFMIWIKHVEEPQTLDQLLNWLHWNS